MQIISKPRVMQNRCYKVCKKGAQLFLYQYPNSVYQNSLQFYSRIEAGFRWSCLWNNIGVIGSYFTTPSSFYNILNYFQNSSTDVTFTIEQCHAINNIEFVLQSIRPFVDELKINEILRKIEDINGGLVADACRKTVKVLVDNAVENVETQILNVSMHFFEVF